MLDVTKLDHFDETEYLVNTLSLGLAIRKLCHYAHLPKQRIAAILQNEALYALTMMPNEERKQMLAKCQQRREEARIFYEHQNSQLQKN